MQFNNWTMLKKGTFVIELNSEPYQGNLKLEQHSNGLQKLLFWIIKRKSTLAVSELKGTQSLDYLTASNTNEYCVILTCFKPF